MEPSQIYRHALFYSRLCRVKQTSRTKTYLSEEYLTRHIYWKILREFKQKLEWILATKIRVAPTLAVVHRYGKRDYCPFLV